MWKPASSERRLRLSILYHPQTERIGDICDMVCHIDTGIIRMGRHELEFNCPRNPVTARPLDDPYISRQPLLMRCSATGFNLQLSEHRSSVHIDRELVTSHCTIDFERLRCGVLLQLAGRVVLLLNIASDIPLVDDDCGLVGESGGLQSVRDMICKVARSQAAVLLVGETGTGKELVARALHQRSDHSAQPLVTVNMAAIPSELTASELFGAKRGAFTGADRDHRGYFSKANGGLLFLDEVGACSPVAQPQLLRALQEGEIQSPGGGVEQVNVRVIAATDTNLWSDTLGFNAALRHRLAGVEIYLPPLRERIDDLGRLMRHLLPAMQRDHSAEEPSVVRCWATLVAEFAAYNWPGNVRELRNFCGQVSLVEADSGIPVMPDNISLKLHQLPPAPASPERNRYKPAREITDTEVRAAMMAARWEVSRAARELEISRQALYKRIEEIPDLRVVVNIPSAEVEAVYHRCHGVVELAATRLQVSRTALRRRWRALDLIPRNY